MDPHLPRVDGDELADAALVPTPVPLVAVVGQRRRRRRLDRRVVAGK